MSATGTMLVTGSTGVVGAEVLAEARLQGWETAGCSARGGEESVAWRMGAEVAPAELLRHWDVIVHAAARPRFNLPAEEAVAGNLAPVAALEPLVQSGTHVVHVSTAFAVGLGNDTRSEKLSDYRNTYEWSKAAAERDAAARYGATVVRPPLVIGRRSDGAVTRFSGLYSILQATVTGLLPAFIGEPSSSPEIVSTCDTARCILQLANTGPVPEPVVLGTGPGALRLTDVINVMYVALNRWRAEAGPDPLEVPRTITPDQWYRFFLPFARPHLTARRLRSIDLLSTFIPYLSMSEPLEVTWPVQPVAPAIDVAVTAWAERFPRLALSQPRPWTSEGDR